MFAVSQTGLGLKIYQRITHHPPPTSEGLASQEYTIHCMKEEEMHLSFIVHCEQQIDNYLIIGK